MHLFQMNRSFVFFCLAVALVLLVVWIKGAPLGPADDGKAESLLPTEPVSSSVPDPITGRVPAESHSGRQPVVSPLDDLGEGEPIASSPEDGLIAIGGGVIVLDAQGFEHHREDGFFTAYYTDEDRTVHRRLVRVRGGSFEVRMAPVEHFSIRELTLGGRPAFIERDTEFAAGPEQELVVRALWPRVAILHVLDWSSGEPLSQLHILRCSDRALDGTDHPGDLGVAEVVLSEASSPVELRPKDCGLSSSIHDVVLWIHAPGYSWAHIGIDYDQDTEWILRLKPAAELSITLVNQDRLLSATGRRGTGMHPVLRIRKSLEDAEHPTISQEELDGEYVEHPMSDQSAFLNDPQLRFLIENPQMSGPLVLERSLRGAKNPTVITGLSPGRVAVSVELGELHGEDPPTSVGWVPAQLEAGQRTHVTLVLKTLPEPSASAMLAGTLFLPPSWGEKDVLLFLERRGHLNSSNFIRIPLSKMTAVAEREGLYRWSAGSVIPGRFLATLNPFPYEQMIDVPPEGMLEVNLEIGEPANVVVRFLDQESGAPVPIAASMWSCRRPDGSKGETAESANRDDEVGVSRFVAPAGEVSLFGVNKEYWPHMDFHLIHPGDNEITVHLKKSYCGMKLEVEINGNSARYEAIGDYFHIWRDNREVPFECSEGKIILPEPGVYELHIDSIEGYERVESEQVRVLMGEFVKHIVVLKKTK